MNTNTEFIKLPYGYASYAREYNGQIFYYDSNYKCIGQEPLNGKDFGLYLSEMFY